MVRELWSIPRKLKLVVILTLYSSMFSFPTMKTAIFTLQRILAIWCVRSYMYSLGTLSKVFLPNFYVRIYNETALIRRSIGLEKMSDYEMALSMRTLIS